MWSVSNILSHYIRVWTERTLVDILITFELVKVTMWKMFAQTRLERSMWKWNLSTQEISSGNAGTSFIIKEDSEQGDGHDFPAMDL